MKIIKFNSKNREEMFKNEVNLLKKADGISNIVQCIESWVTNNSGIIIMNYLGNTSLYKLFEKAKLGEIILTEQDIWKYITQLAIVINEFHNDIKCNNIMIYSNNAYLIDLGIMTEGESSCDGTDNYMPYNKIKCARQIPARRANPSYPCNSDICPKQHDIYALAIIMIYFIYYTEMWGKYYLIDILSHSHAVHRRHSGENRNDHIKRVLRLDKNYNVSDEYKEFIIDIIDEKNKCCR